MNTDFNETDKDLIGSIKNLLNENKRTIIEDDDSSFSVYKITFRAVSNFDVPVATVSSRSLADDWIDKFQEFQEKHNTRELHFKIQKITVRNDQVSEQELEKKLLKSKRK